MFDRYLMRHQFDWRRRALALASIIVHALLAVVLVVWSFFHVDEIAPPALALTVFSSPPPPPAPPPPPPGPRKGVAEHKESMRREVPPNIPNLAIEEAKPEAAETPDENEKSEGPSGPAGEEGPDGGVDGGVKDGLAGGKVGGTVGGKVGGTVGGLVGSMGKGPPPTHATGKRVAWFQLAALRQNHPDPHLPEWFTSQHAGQEVKGSYLICLDAEGHVSEVSPLSNIGGVDEAIMQYIRQNWTYKRPPYPLCGESRVLFQIR